MIDNGKPGDKNKLKLHSTKNKKPGYSPGFFLIMFKTYSSEISIRHI